MQTRVEPDQRGMISGVESALTKLGSWDALQNRIVFGGDVAGVLAYARRGEVAAAIVYKTETLGIADIAIFEEASDHGAGVAPAPITGEPCTDHSSRKRS